jgi:hypothetical protein
MTAHKSIRRVCGYSLASCALTEARKTGSMKVFPFKPTFGYWTLQVDTERAYSRHPAGPVARILVGIA